MDPPALIAALQQDGAALARAAETAPDVDIPSCPGWDMAALVGHTGSVHRWAAAIVGRRERVSRRDLPPPPDGHDERLAWFRAGVDELGAVLAAQDPEAEAWTFGSSGEHRVWWWCRRQAAETATHRWDAENAATVAGVGAPPDDVGAEVAVAGIEEYLTDFLPGVVEREGLDLHGSLHLHTTDPGVDGEWLVDLAARPVTSRRQHVQADTAIRGPVSDLLLWLWNRLPGGGARLEVFGSADPIMAWPRLRL
ncbi:MAG: maleylpyruvate isomerase N-terminal domain-containing protein [Acidimicrobiales bacterium]